MAKANPTKQPLEVLRAEVPRIEVGKYYLQAEFGRIFPGDVLRVILDQQINSLSETEFWRLLEAVSLSYRLNRVFWMVSNQRYLWREERWRAADLKLTGMGPQIDALTQSEAIGRDPIKLKVYLQSYFAKHTKSDPEGLGLFRPDESKLYYPRLLLREQDGEVLLLDGTNRLIKLLLQGATEVVVFRAANSGKPDKYRIGDSVFYLLRQQYEQAQSDEDRKVILRTAAILMRQSLDGWQAVKTYWVEHARKEQTRTAGRQLLSEALDG